MHNDHYVPQFYLRAFSPPGQEGRIWCYERNKKPALRGIRSVSCEEDFYTLRDLPEGADNRQIDRAYSITESEAAPLLKSLLVAPRVELTEKQYEVMGRFISCLSARTILFKERLISFEKGMEDKFFRSVEEKKKGFEEMAASAAPEDRQRWENARELMKELDGAFDRARETPDSGDFYLFKALKLAEEFKPILETKRWRLIQSDGSRVFITSDHPLILVRPKGSVKVGNLKECTMILPLSPQRCLVLTDEPVKDEVTRMDRERVIGVNQYVMATANRQVYANISSKDIETAFNKTKEGENLRVVLE